MKIHFIGIGGRGMKRVSELACLLGYEVTGSDLKADLIISHILKKYAIIYPNHSENYVKEVDLVVYSIGINESHVEIQSAQKLFIPILTRMQMVSKLVRLMNQKTITILGSFGKTTTTTLMSLVLDEGGLDPSFYIGGHVPNYNGGVKVGKGEFAVVEGCEYKSEFFHLDSSALILTNIEENHLEYFNNTENLVKVFERFININNTTLRSIVLCYDSDLVRDNVVFHSKYYNIDSYGLYYGNWLVKNIVFNNKNSSMNFDIFYKGEYIRTFFLNIVGEQYALNATGVIITARNLGISYDMIQNGLLNYIGIKRRFELKFENKNLTIIDDMARMPIQLKKTIEAARLRYKDRKIIIICGFWGALNKRNLNELADALIGGCPYILKVNENGEQFGGMEFQDADEMLKKILNNLGVRSYLEDEIYLADLIRMMLNNGHNPVIITVGYDSFLNKFDYVINNALRDLGIKDNVEYLNYM